MELVLVKNGKVIGKVVEKLTVYMVQRDDDPFGNDINGYGNLAGSWIVGEIKDLDVSTDEKICEASEL